MTVTRLIKSDLIVLVILCILYINYFPAWINKWFDFDSFYSFFPFLTFFGFQFFKTKANELSQAIKKPTKFGLLPFIIGALIYFTGVKADINSLIGISLPLLISGTILFIYGTRIFYIVLPIIILFSLSIPTFHIFRLTVPLQIFLADIITKILIFLNINAYNVGSNLYIDNYSVSIEAGCTGIKSISSLLIVSFMLFYFKNISVLKKTLLIFFTLIISFLGNIIRILLIDFYIIYNGMRGAEAFHYGLGIAVFVISLIVIFVLNELIEEDRVAAN